MRSLHRQLSNYWASAPGLVVHGPATEDELLELEKRVGALPASLRDFLRFANGFSDEGAGCDENGFVFWPSGRMELAGDDRLFSLKIAGVFLLFADYLHMSWAYAIRLNGENERGSVFMVGTEDGVPFRVAPTFDDFLEKYLSDDPALYGP